MHVRKKTNKIILGITIILIGVIIGIIPIFIQKEKDASSMEKVEEYIKITSKEENTTTEEEPPTQEKNIEDEDFLLILEIPKINLLRGVYPLNSRLNSIEYNVTIAKESTTPDVLNGNVVLIAHNGTAYISFFNKLDRLEKNDIANIYYQGIKYTYQVNEIYDVEKDGSVEVSREEDKSTLTLITCKKNTEDRQLVLILYLVSTEAY